MIANNLKRRHPGKLLKLMLLIVPLGLVAYLIGRQWWAKHHFQVALSCLERRQFAEAEVHLNQCLAVWQGRGELHLLLAQAARRRGECGRAETHLAECERLQGPTRGLRLERLLALAQQGHLTAPIEGPLLSALKEDSPEKLLILEALIQGYLFAYRLDRAWPCVQELLRCHPDHVEALVWRGWLWQGRQHIDEAEKDYRRALDLDGHHFEARRYLAEVLLFRKQPEEAWEHFQQLHRQEPGNARLLLGLARCQRMRGKVREARRLLEEVIRKRPKDVTALRELGKALLQEGQPASAERWLRRAVAADLSDFETWYVLGQCLFRCNKRTEAKQCLARSEGLKTQWLRLRQLKRKVDKRPRDPDPRCEAGTICLRQGHLGEALRWFDGALLVDPGHRPTHKALAIYYDKIGKADLAAQHRRRAIRGAVHN